MKSINLSTKKFAEIKKSLKRNNWNVTNAYQDIVSQESMFGYAFFGWSATPYQKRKLNHIWRGILFVKLEHDKSQPLWQKEQTKRFLEIIE